MLLTIIPARHFETNPKSLHNKCDTQWMCSSGCPSTDATTLPLGFIFHLVPPWRNVTQQIHQFSLLYRITLKWIPWVTKVLKKIIFLQPREPQTTRRQPGVCPRFSLSSPSSLGRNTSPRAGGSQGCWDPHAAPLLSASSPQPTCVQDKHLCCQWEPHGLTVSLKASEITN